MAPGADRPGHMWCANCSKWKAEKAFVRSRYKRGTQLWQRLGFVWHRYKTCNRCSRVYFRKPLMSVAQFVEAYGAEEHNDSEAELDDDYEIDDDENDENDD